jgi:hypothetical protein
MYSDACLGCGQGGEGATRTGKTALAPAPATRRLPGIEDIGDASPADGRRE